MTAKDVLQKLQTLANPEIATFQQTYFKLEVYGEKDVFMGIKAPDLSSLANQYDMLPLAEIESLIHSEYHEARMMGLLILCDQFEKAKTEEERKKIFDFYLQNTRSINNWDLVDASCRTIIGGYLLNKTDRSVLYRLADSRSLWEERMALVSTHPFIKKEQFDDTFKIARKLFSCKHELIQKTIGWMLREIGRLDKKALMDFLSREKGAIPQAALRYACEPFSHIEKTDLIE